jgi:hypothetical protein
MEKLHSKTLRLSPSDAFQHKLCILAKIRVSVQAINVICFNTTTAPK